jgi:TrbC/VIRB2 pilin
VKAQYSKKPTLLKTAFVVAGATLAVPLAAHAGGLDNVKSSAESLLADLKLIIPVVATLVGIGIFAGYSAKFIEKQDAVRWGIGCALIGSVGTLVAALIKF